MTIEATLSQDEFIRLAIWRHFNRRWFFFYALTAALTTAYTVVFGATYWLLVIVWIPFALYILLGIFEAIRDSRQADNPILLKTKYKFDGKGVSISNAQGDSQLIWEQFISWRYIAQCYVLLLTGGLMIVIPKSALSTTKVTKLESMLKQYVGV